jgi:hypothetical protein
MNPNVGENQRQMEAAPPLHNGEKVFDESTEKNLVSSPENKPQTQSLAASSQAASDMALPSQAITDLNTDDSATAIPHTTPADDTDRIEKEWVDKAKTVIAHTKDDPFEQKNEMSRVKAEYIQKRFNKTIKADGTVHK